MNDYDGRIWIPCGKGTDFYGVPQPGRSVGSEGLATAGTIAAIAFDTDGHPCVLSSAHVLVSGTTPNSYIMGPGSEDNGQPVIDRIGTLQNYVLDSRGDYATALLSGDSYNRAMFPTEELITSAALPQVGDLVEKSGRSTDVTWGEVTSASTTQSVSYGAPWGDISITGFIIAPRSDPSEVIAATGDSGALIYLPGTGVGLGLITAVSTSPTVAVLCSFLTTALSDLNVSLDEPATAATEEWVEVEGVVDPHWMIYGNEMLATVSLTPARTINHAYLFTSQDFVISGNGILWGKRSTDSTYSPIGINSRSPTCFIGNIAAGETVTLNLKLVPVSGLDLSGNQSAPVYIGHGRTLLGDLIN